MGWNGGISSVSRAAVDGTDTIGVGTGECVGWSGAGRISWVEETAGAWGVTLAVAEEGTWADGAGAWRISWVEETAGVWGVMLAVAGGGTLANGVGVLRTS